MLNVLNKIPSWTVRTGLLSQQPRPHSPTGDLAGQNSKGMCQGGKPGTGKLYVYVAPPTPVGALSMA